MAAHHVQITTTTETKDQAKSLADGLLQKRLAACVQIVGPIESAYWWNGALERAEEWLCIVKTSGDLTGSVVATIQANHAYENPEITATPIVDGSPSYLDWIDREVVDGPTQRGDPPS